MRSKEKAAQQVKGRQGKVLYFSGHPSWVYWLLRGVPLCARKSLIVFMICLPLTICVPPLQAYGTVEAQLKAAQRRSTGAHEQVRLGGRWGQAEGEQMGAGRRAASSGMRPHSLGNQTVTV